MAKHTVARAGLVAGPLPLFGITLAAKTGQLQVQGHAAGRLAAHQLGEMYGPQGLQAAFQAQLDGLGFSLVEVLSQCPTGWGKSPVDAVKWLDKEMKSYFPLGLFKDIRAEKTQEVAQ